MRTRTCVCVCLCKCWAHSACCHVQGSSPTPNWIIVVVNNKKTVVSCSQALGCANKTCTALFSAKILPARLHASHHEALETPLLWNITLYWFLLWCHQKMVSFVLVCTCKVQGSDFCYLFWYGCMWYLCKGSKQVQWSIFACILHVATFLWLYKSGMTKLEVLYQAYLALRHPQLRCYW